MRFSVVKWRRLSLVGMLLGSLLAVLPNTADAKQIGVNVAMAYPTMLVGQEGSGEKGTNYVRIALSGFDIPSEKERMPVNVAIVIDKSGSMQGDKMQQAIKAAVQAVDRLNDEDIISVIAYDSSVRVIVPATKASSREEIKSQIRSIAPGGNTALFAGVSKGAAEVRKFLDDKRVNRVILLSDGLANVGPQTPSELEQLGESLIEEGISVSTMGLGLGYNEDLMSRLALSSSGNHVFIEDAENLVQVFQKEFDDVLSVVAQKIRVDAKLAEGVRPVKVLNYPADITGQNVTIDLGQLYSGQERYFVIEVEVPLVEAKPDAKDIADVSVKYMNMVTETQDKLTSTVQMKYSDSKEIADKSVDKVILASCVIQIANERNRKATELRDAGKIDEAKQLLLFNSKYLGDNYRFLKLPELKLRCDINSFQADNLAPAQWAENRKAMRQQQVLDATQQSYGGKGEKSDFSKSPKSKQQW